MLKYLLALLVAALPFAAPAQPTRFSVIVEGSGPDLILIPGLTSSRGVWDQAVASLGGRYRVHRIQVAGFGGEPAGGNAEGPVLAPLLFGPGETAESVAPRAAALRDSIAAMSDDAWRAQQTGTLPVFVRNEAARPAAKYLSRSRLCWR
jgi:pimeloyl-ACP methyl ester carboxylesterase